VQLNDNCLLLTVIWTVLLRRVADCYQRSSASLGTCLSSPALRQSRFFQRLSQTIVMTCALRLPIHELARALAVANDTLFYTSLRFGLHACIAQHIENHSPSAECTPSHKQYTNDGNINNVNIKTNPCQTRVAEKKSVCMQHMFFFYLIIRCTPEKKHKIYHVHFSISSCVTQQI